MNYKVQAVGTVELKQFIGTVRREHGKDFILKQIQSFADLADAYDGGNVKFLQSYAHAIENIGDVIYRINNYLTSKAACAIADELTLNRAKAGDIQDNCLTATVDTDGSIACLCTVGFLIEADCTSDCDDELVRGYAREALVKLISGAITSCVLDGVKIGDASELNVTIVDK